MTDPFAAAQVSTPAASNTSATPAARPAADPFTSSVDSADPFATSSDFRGDFSPSPTMDALAGRLVVMIPREFDPAAEDKLSDKPGATRELYTVDLYVLTGGRMAWWFTDRGNPELGTEDELKEIVVENVSPEEPFVNLGRWVPQGGIIGKLRKSHREGRPFLGVVTRGPQKPDRDKGVTPAQIERRYQDWVNKGKPGEAPKYSWSLADPTPEQRQIAIGWWGKNKGDIAPINPAGAPAK